MARDIYKGDDEDIVILIRRESTQKAVDLSSGVERIKACFTKQTGSTPLNVFYLPRTASITNGSDIITVSVTDIAEGMPVVGTGIPVGAVVLKTPSSTSSPTSAGTVKISMNASTTNASASLVFGHISITDAPNGEITISLHEAETSVLKTSLSGTVTNLMSWEVETIISGVTKTVQFLKSLNVIARTC